MASEFDYEWNLGTLPARVRDILEEHGNRELSIRWMSGGGAEIERDVSEVGLERWKIRCLRTRDLEEIESFLSKALVPLASHEIELHPVYQDAGPSFVGWILWHRKEE